MVEKYQVNAVEDLDHLVGIRGKRILEIGGDTRLQVANLMLNRGASHVTTVNYAPNFPDQNLGNRLVARKLDGTKLNEHFPGGSFDVVFGVALIEHVHDLAQLLDQVYDVLTEDGAAVLKGSPIWTSELGHHLYVRRPGRHFRFHVPGDNPIPPWHHLLWTRAEMEAFLQRERGIDPEDARAIGAFVYEHRALSRKGYSQILQAFRSSRFPVVELKEILGTAPDDALMQVLSATEWGKDGDRFEVRGIQALLRKQASSNGGAPP